MDLATEFRHPLNHMCGYEFLFDPLELLGLFPVFTFKSRCLVGRNFLHELEFDRDMIGKILIVRFVIKP